METLELQLKYDFDIFDIMPKDVFADPKITEMMGNIGIKQDSVGNKMALFRNQATIDAILAGPPQLKECLEAAKFGFTLYDSGAPEGHYLAEDEGMRLHVIKKLTEVMPNYDLKPATEGGALEGGFHIGDFLMYFASAKAIDMAASRVSSTNLSPQAPRASSKPFFLRPTFLLLCVFIAISYVLLG